MARDLRYLPVAQQDLLDTVDWIALESPPRALDWVDDVGQRIHALAQAQAPELGRRPRSERIAKQGYRVLSIDANLVFYGFNGHEVIIYRVLRGGRNYQAIL